MITKDKASIDSSYFYVYCTKDKSKKKYNLQQALFFKNGHTIMAVNILFNCPFLWKKIADSGL